MTIYSPLYPLCSVLGPVDLCQTLLNMFLTVLQGCLLPRISFLRSRKLKPTKYTFRGDTKIIYTYFSVILLNGFQIMWRSQYVILHHVAFECQQHSLATQQQSRRSSNASLNSSQPCSGAKHSYTGTRERGWTKWNLQKPSQTWMTSCQNTSSIRYEITFINQ